MSSENEKEGDVEQQPKSELLAQQKLALERMVKRDGRGVTEIAKAIGVGRQTLYQWMWGQAAIAEKKIPLLCKEFNCVPAELRYDVSIFNYDDLVDITCRVEREFCLCGITLSPEQKGLFVAGVYREYQNLQRIYNTPFAKGAIDSRIREIMLLAGLQLDKIEVKAAEEDVVGEAGEDAVEADTEDAVVEAAAEDAVEVADTN